MVRYGGLGKVDARLDVGGAQAHVLADGATAPFLERLQDAAAGGVRDRVKNAIEGLGRGVHVSFKTRVRITEAKGGNGGEHVV